MANVVEWSADETGYTITVKRGGKVVETHYHGNYLPDGKVTLHVGHPKAMRLIDLRISAEIDASVHAQRLGCQARELQFGS